MVKPIGSKISNASKATKTTKVAKASKVSVAAPVSKKVTAKSPEKKTVKAIAKKSVVDEKPKKTKVSNIPEKKSKVTKKTSLNGEVSESKLFSLVVLLIEGPVTKEFLKKNKVVSRTIEILGSQTLSQLHHKIFSAFDREEEHMYEFQLKGKGPNDPKADRYVLDMKQDDGVGEVEATKISSLSLKEGESFGYVFDFGDEWWHQIYLDSIGEPDPKKDYPRVSKKLGASPPQYPDLSDEDDCDCEDDCACENYCSCEDDCECEDEDEDEND
ncbi:MAG: plasmid pRiA4b ORF-3 family protein [Candidatus Riflebacteria bacterium]|nr:plasmid pRiA4b ORF-3 family protein [Candidatus Riflebacteria bacterium]